VTYGPEFFKDRSVTVMASAVGLVPALCGLLSPSSVLDVGCGQGEWVEAFKVYCCEDVLGVDIAAPEGENYLRVDLTERLGLGRVFNLALCLEVGEHLPESAADTLIDTLATHSDTVVFSAAVVGQEGTGHINCQPHEYWHEKFEARGYAMEDTIRPLIAMDWRISPWYRSNVFLYRRGS
jgi:methyltransferase family protein